ncbi:hypothetical protein SDC9_77911 [bioreactor metagenome]|uniref:Uncharacterized protein n=1 Tax=bioreactor metagenome TaxID=1076179 RepID=A0A644YS63_9ZZZZ
MEPLSRVADAGSEQGLHIHVDVLVVRGECNRPGLNVRKNALQTLRDGGRVLGRDYAAARQHLRVGKASGDVLPVKPLVEVDGSIEVVDQRVRFLSKPSGPEFHKGFSLIEIGGRESPARFP